jgi:hypothetical protein
MKTLLLVFLLTSTTSFAKKVDLVPLSGTYTVKSCTSNNDGLLKSLLNTEKFEAVVETNSLTLKPVPLDSASSVMTFDFKSVNQGKTTTKKGNISGPGEYECKKSVSLSSLKGTELTTKLEESYKTGFLACMGPFHLVWSTESQLTLKSDNTALLTYEDSLHDVDGPYATTTAQCELEKQ